MTIYLDEKTKRIIEFMEPRKKDKILVIGTGIFPKAEYFLFNNFKCKNIISIDIDNKNLENGSKILPEIRFEFMDAEKKFVFKDNWFDKVLFADVLEHLNNERNALLEIGRILKKNGKLIMTVPKRRWFNIFSPVSLFQHKREYNEKEITDRMKEAGFRIEKIFAGGSIYDLFNLWIHLICKYVFKKIKSDFFIEKINESNKKDFKGKGTGIIIRAAKRKN